jgi:hypothetical protein
MKRVLDVMVASVILAAIGGAVALWRLESPTLTVARESPPVRIADDRDFPDGAQYRGPDGELYRKPVYESVDAIPSDTTHARSNRDVYDLQERCGRRAEQVFARKDYENFELAGHSHTFTYQNHYSLRYNKCFFQVLHFQSFKDGFYTRELELLDLNENTPYGRYFSTVLAGPDDKYTKPALSCEVRGKLCRYESEWVDLASQYMED